jgi:hypothetical protein
MLATRADGSLRGNADITDQWVDGAIGRSSMIGSGVGGGCLDTCEDGPRVGQLQDDSVTRTEQPGELTRPPYGVGCINGRVRARRVVLEAVLMRLGRWRD